MRGTPLFDLRHRSRSGWLAPVRGAILISIAILAVGAAVATGAASLIGGDGKIHACAAKRDGALRVVKAGKKCKRTETAISWNQSGQRGPTGPAGAIGQRGADGAPGAAGGQGPAGSPGQPSTADPRPTPTPAMTDPTIAAVTLAIGDGPQVRVKRIGGCRDLSSGPEACYLEFQAGATPPLFAWISEAANGSSPRRTITIRQSNQYQGSALPGLVLSEAAITRVDFGTFDGSSSDPLCSSS